MQHLGLVPIRNFAQVDTNFFRSAQPEYSYEYLWLKEVASIDVIVNLRAESQHDTVMAKGIEVINFDVADHKEPSIEQAHNFIRLIKRLIKQGKRFLIHCEHGHGRTSTFCVLARIAQGWSLENAIKEENEKYHYHFKHPAQLNFLKQNFSNVKI